MICKVSVPPDKPLQSKLLSRGFQAWSEENRGSVPRGARQAPLMAAQAAKERGWDSPRRVGAGSWWGKGEGRGGASCGQGCRRLTGGQATLGLAPRGGSGVSCAGSFLSQLQ